MGPSCRWTPRTSCSTPPLTTPTTSTSSTRATSTTASAWSAHPDRLGAGLERGRRASLSLPLALLVDALLARGRALGPGAAGCALVAAAAAPAAGRLLGQLGTGTQGRAHARVELPACSSRCCRTESPPCPACSRASACPGSRSAGRAATKSARPGPSAVQIRRFTGSSRAAEQEKDSDSEFRSAFSITFSSSDPRTSTGRIREAEDGKARKALKSSESEWFSCSAARLLPVKFSYLNGIGPGRSGAAQPRGQDLQQLAFGRGQQQRRMPRLDRGPDLRAAFDPHEVRAEPSARLRTS